MVDLKSAQERKEGRERRSKKWKEGEREKGDGEYDQVVKWYTYNNIILFVVKYSLLSFCDK